MTRTTLSQQLETQATELAKLREENAQLKASVSNLQQYSEMWKTTSAKLRDAEEKLAVVEKTAAEAKNAATYSSQRADKAESELEQAHAVLDGVEGAPTREYDREYGKGHRNVVTRLAGAFLAIAKEGSTK